MLTKCVLLLSALFTVSHCAVNKLPFDYGPTFNDTLLPKGDSVKQPLDLTNSPLYFLNNKYTNIFVDVDGALWLGSWHCDEDCPIPMKYPVQSGKQMVSCYWADADSTLNPNSAVWFRNANDQQSWTKLSSYMDKALGNKAQFDFTSNQKSLIIVTYIHLTYAEGSDSTPTNTYQCALASDGINSYTIFTFGELNWGTSPGQTLPAAVGVDDGSSNSMNSGLVLPQSWTTDVVSLTSYTNFKTNSQGGGPFGWCMVSKCSPIIPPYYPIPPNTPTKHCYANGDPHYYTFDGQAVDSAFGSRPNGYPYGYPTSNQPTDHYVMMATTNCKDTNWPPVSVVAEIEQITANAPPNPRPLAGVHGVIVTFYWNTASIGTKNEIIVEMRDNKLTVGSMTYTSYDCPAKLCANYTFSVKPYNGGFKLTTGFGLQVSYANWQADIYLAYLDPLQGAVFGYCGNMNGNKKDDNYCWDPTESNYASYQYCWPESYLAGHISDWGPGYYDCPYTFYAMERYRQSLRKPAEHKAVGTTIDTTDAERLCGVLVDPNGVFQMCQSVSTISNIYDSCVADLSIMNGDQTILCNYAQQLARQCMEENNLGTLQWRSASFCPLSCPVNSNYSSGMSSCPNTCDDPFASAFCSDSNTEGCQCNNGYLFENGACVLPQQCGGCLDDQGNTVGVGGSWLSMDCENQCTCTTSGTQCTLTGCDVNAKCVAVGSTATCKCNNNYAGDGFYCSKTDNCFPSNQCMNGATCVSQRSGYICSCQVGYTGQFCDIEIDHCNPDPCVNGDCVNSRIGYTCNCTYGYAGPTCDSRVNWCASFPCQNLATCESDVDGYTCKCADGFSGVNCENNVTITTTTMAPLTTTTPFYFNCTGKANRNYPIATASCMNTYVYCYYGVAELKECVLENTDFDPVSFLCAYKCFIPVCRDSSCYPTIL